VSSDVPDLLDCPSCAAGSLLVAIAGKAADAIAAGRPDLVERWADLAVRIRGTADFVDVDDAEIAP
jgi:hypothetical protein